MGGVLGKDETEWAKGAYDQLFSNAGVSYPGNTFPQLEEFFMVFQSLLDQKVIDKCQALYLGAYAKGQKSGIGFLVVGIIFTLFGFLTIPLGFGAIFVLIGAVLLWQASLWVRGETEMEQFWERNGVLYELDGIKHICLVPSEVVR